MNTKQGILGIKWFSLALAATLLVIAVPSAHARDRGINQPGRAGNHHVAGAAAVGGSAAQTRAVADPGVNQPGAAGNARRAGDPGVNQPGAAGNAGRAGDPGVNQPGAAGNPR